MSEPVVAIVVAAGSGVRLGASTAGGTGPKALRRLRGIALVRWAVDAMLAAGAERVVVVVTPGNEDGFEAAMAGVYHSICLTPGGATRQESVLAGLRALPELPGDAIVLVHDAARPLVPVEVTKAVIDAVRSGAQAVVPAVPVTDSLREVVPHQRTHVVDRSRYVAVQTPQGFRLGTLLSAHERAVGDTSFTDDAAVCEAAGHDVVLVPGSRLSMKVTAPVDFALAEALLDQEES